MKKMLWALAVLLLPTITQSQEKNDSVLRFSLKEATSFAMQTAYSVKSAAIDLEVAKKKIFETTAIGLPQVSGKVSYQNNFTVPQLVSYPVTYNGQSLSPQVKEISIDGSAPIVIATGDPQYLQFGSKQNTTFDLTVSQLIFSGEYIVGLQAARIFKQLSELGLDKSKNDIRESVAKTYCLVLVTAENLKILNQSYEAISKIYEEMTKMNEQGFNESTDVDQIEISKTNVENMLSSVKNQNQIAQKLLKLQMGIDFTQQVELTDSVAAVVDAGNQSYLNTSNFSIENNIDYKLMLTQENISLLSLRREKSKFLPTIAAFYRHEELADKPVINFNPANVVGITVEIPIFASGMKLAQVKQASLNYEKTQLARKQVQQGLLMDYEQSKNTYEAAYNSFINQKKNLDLSKRIYDKTLVKYKGGVTSSFDLNQNQTQFLTAQSSYFMAVMDLFNAKAKLEKLQSSK